MTEFCTCGAELPPDALFCHKCGKAQRDIVAPEAPPPPPPKPEETVWRQPAVSPLPLNFRNPIAMRIAMLVSIIATLLSSFLPFLSWMAAGFFVVFFYKRKTGSLMNVGAGVRLGWLTGLLMFGLWSVLLMAKLIPEAISGKLGETLQDQFRTLPSQDPMVRQMLDFFQSGPGLAAILFFALCAFFCFITGLSMAGGALGAKMVGRD
jgi:hypothetical protein